MKKICLIIVLALTTQLVRAQSKGDSLRSAGALEAAYMAYGAEFFQNPSDAKIAYKLASTLSLTNQVDTSFFFLNIALKANSSLRPLSDSDLLNLSTDPRWEAIEQGQLRKYQAANGKLKKPEYALKLIRMIIKDQGLDYHRDLGTRYYAQNGVAPHWFFLLNKIKSELNAENLIEMNRLLAQYGWPKYSDVGNLAADAPLLVINHHESEEFRMKYLDQVKEVCLAGEGSCMEYAKIHDRILVNTDRPQTFGMQFKFNSSGDLEPFPIENPETVDQRRKEIGLEPLAVYLKRKINYDWKVKQKD